MNFAASMFGTMKTVPAVYEDSQGTFDLLVAIVETDKEFKVSSRDQMIGSDIVGTVLSDPRIKRGGKLMANDCVYRVDPVAGEQVPGLVDLALKRLSGESVPVFDISNAIPMNDLVTINGIEVKANINRSVVVEEYGDNGDSLISSKMFISIKEADSKLVALHTAKAITVYGKERAIVRKLNDGVGMRKIIA